MKHSSLTQRKRELLILTLLYGDVITSNKEKGLVRNYLNIRLNQCQSTLLLALVLLGLHIFILKSLSLRMELFEISLGNGECTLTMQSNNNALIKLSSPPHHYKTFALTLCFQHLWHLLASMNKHSQQRVETQKFLGPAMGGREQASIILHRAGFHPVN